MRYTGETVRAVLGYDPDELVGRGFLELVHPGDAEHTIGIIAEATVRPGTHWASVETTPRNSTAGRQRRR